MVSIRKFQIFAQHYFPNGDFFLLAGSGAGRYCCSEAEVNHSVA